MEQEEQWLNWAIELQSLAQSGLFYSRDVYDRERFERIREISTEILSRQTEMPKSQVRDLFCCETGYQTPKLDTRAALFQNDRILLVQENDGRWSLPGGWVDVGLSIGENTVKEVREEAGLEAVPERIIAVQDRDRHNPTIYAYKICKIFVQCRILGGSFQKNNETIASAFYSLADLPLLCEEKNTSKQIQICFDAFHSVNWQTVFD